MTDGRPTRDAKVLELRVHGVNNTTPWSLLDLPPDSVRVIAGDKLGSFWEPTADAQEAAIGADPSARGAIPKGVRREAYSWGGMVRTVPNVGGLSVGGVALGVVARLLYAIVLPFSIGNAVQWSRSLSTPDNPPGVRANVTAGAGRFFGLLLTLLFTTTAVTIAIDIIAVQCGPTPSLCGPLEGALGVLGDLTQGQRLAMLSLVPVVAIVALAAFAGVSRMRYDVLPGMELHQEDTTLPGGGDVADQEGPGGPRRFVPKAVLAQPGFWANRVTTYLTRAHIAASIALTTIFVAGQAAAGHWLVYFTVVFWAACALLVVTTIFVWAVPTMTIVADPDDAHSAETERSWARLPSMILVVVAGALMLIALIPLAIAPKWNLAESPLLPADVMPLAIVATAAVLALTGIWWRKPGNRKTTAWFGSAPAVFMTIALTVAVGTSAIVVVTTADWLNGAKGPAALIGQEPPAKPSHTVSLTWTDETTKETGTVEIGGTVTTPPSIQVSSIYVVLGTLIVIALLVALIPLGAALAFKRVGKDPAKVDPPPAPRDPADRVSAWAAPERPDDLPPPQGGVLPPSRAVLFGRIRSSRTTAARAHLVEPVAGVLAIAFGAAILLALVSIWAGSQATSIVDILPPGVPVKIVKNTLNVGMWLLAVVGIGLVGLLVAGGSKEGTRPLGTVWDIACFLPRTGHPFGPPCYAERAAPEIAGHLNQWLQREDRRAVLAAHSMGAVLSVAALGVLASSEHTRPVLSRISLLTFGVQLRPFFGRMLPELLGPEVLGTHAAVAPRLFAWDPWQGDFDAQRALSLTVPAVAAPAAVVPRSLMDRFRRPEPPTAAVTGTLLRADGDDGPLAVPDVHWVSLWRLTDFLGYPAMSTATGGDDGSWRNDLDRRVDELDKTGYLVSVGTHGDYYRTSGYMDALMQLSRRSRP